LRHLWRREHGLLYELDLHSRQHHLHDDVVIPGQLVHLYGLRWLRANLLPGQPVPRRRLLRRLRHRQRNLRGRRGLVWLWHWHLRCRCVRLVRRGRRLLLLQQSLYGPEHHLPDRLDGRAIDVRGMWRRRPALLHHLVRE
jgi:hypothetical protein